MTSARINLKPSKLLACEQCILYILNYFSDNHKILFSTEYRNGEYDDISEKAEQKTCYDGWLDCDIPPLPLSKHHEPSLNSTNKIKLALEKARLELKACNLKKSSLDRARGRYAICIQKYERNITSIFWYLYPSIFGNFHSFVTPFFNFKQ